MLRTEHEPRYPVSVCSVCSRLMIDRRFDQAKDCQVISCPRVAVEVNSRVELNRATNRHPGGLGFRHTAPHLPQAPSSEPEPEVGATAASEVPQGRRKLTEAQVAEVRTLYAAGGVKQAELAARFGVSGKSISAIITGRTWPSVSQTSKAA
jgi:DNA-binding XRE family transcriptional regulator